MERSLDRAEACALAFIGGKAAAGARTPGNAEIARAAMPERKTQMSQDVGGSIIVKRLVKRGLLRVSGKGGNRVFTIVSTGQSTVSQAQEQKDALAEMLAEGLALKECAWRLGVSQPRVSKIWKEIRQEVGEL